MREIFDEDYTVKDGVCDLLAWAGAFGISFIIPLLLMLFIERG